MNKPPLAQALNAEYKGPRRMTLVTIEALDFFFGLYDEASTHVLVLETEITDEIERLRRRCDEIRNRT
jgi:hypothetical protein